MDKQELRKFISSVQVPMLNAFESCFLESEIEALRVVIRLVIEFHAFLENFEPASPDEFRLRYEIDSIFSGIEFYTSTARAYAVLVGSTKSRIKGDSISLSSIMEQFKAMYPEFLAEINFENKCRLLLDLYKLQIIFAATLYDY